MTRVTVESFSLPLCDPLSTAAGSIEQREGFLLRVEADDGTVGLGEATPLPGWTESREDCETALGGVEPHLVAGDFETAILETASAPAASHAVSLARADLRARREESTLSRYLGGESMVDAVPVNATVGDGPAGRSAEEAAAAVEAGFECVKVKVGVRPVPADARRLRRVRAAVGPDVEVRADANGAWDRDAAAEAFEACAEVGVSYVEQPLPAGDLEGLAALRGGPVGVALDETLAEMPVSDAIDAGAADVVVLKPMALGGVDRARRTALAARNAGVGVVVTTTIDAVVARTAAVHLAASLPGVRACGLATADRLARDLAPDPAPVADGEIRVPQGAGLGIGEVRLS